MKIILTILFIVAVVYLGYIFLRLEREIVFTESIVTGADKQVVWNYLEAAFLDSSRISSWPNELNEIYTEELELNADLVVTYKSPFSTNQYSYKVTEYVEGEIFTYQSRLGHPLKGGATLTLKDKDPGTELIWAGKYDYIGFSSAALYFKYYFKKRFFERLRFALIDLE